MKATPSKDGRPRLTVNISFRVDKEALIYLLAHGSMHYRLAEMDVWLKEKAGTRTAILKLYRDSVTESDDFWNWKEDRGDDECDEVEAVLVAHVAKLFPDLG